MIKWVLRRNFFKKLKNSGRENSRLKQSNFYVLHSQIFVILEFPQKRI
jgi:hypothetical protein